MTAARGLAAAVALPMPVGPARLTPEREAEIATDLAAYSKHPDLGFACCSAHAPADSAPALLAELAAVRKEYDELAARARRVAASHDTFIYDHADPGTEALAAQYELVNFLAAMPGETELPVAPVESALRLVLARLDEWQDGITPDEIRSSIAEALPRTDMSDRRRRIYIDGHDGAWIDAGQDPQTGESDVAGVTDPWKVTSAADVAVETGSLREIGRCW